MVRRWGISCIGEEEKKVDAIKWTTLALDGTIIVECSRREEERRFLRTRVYI